MINIGLSTLATAEELNRLRLAFPFNLLEPGKYKLEVTGNDTQRTWVFSINVEKQ
jgi:hypothetical protein